MKIGFAQINVTVGDLRGNFDKIATAYEQLAREGTTDEHSDEPGDAGGTEPGDHGNLEPVA